MHLTAKRSQIRVILREHALLIGLAGIYVLIAQSFGIAFNVSVDTKMGGALFWDFAGMLPSMAYFLLIGRFVYMRYVIKPPNQIEWFKADIRAIVTDPHRLLSGLIGTVLMVLVMVSFAQLKRLVPTINPFAWDEPFMVLDQALHFGFHPYELAHAVFGYPVVITAVTGAYNAWLFLLYFVLFTTCFCTRNPRLRMQYFVAFILTWAIGGNLLATVFSSAGPVYYARLGLGETFAPLMNLLNAHASTAPISVVETQNLLWDFYTRPGSLSGISAMPSMHVASSVLMAVYAARFGRWPAIFFGAFATTIMLGSVLLAWHYAIDGYLGALVAYGAWKLSGWIVARDIWGLEETRQD